MCDKRVIAIEIFAKFQKERYTKGKIELLRKEKVI